MPLTIEQQQALAIAQAKRKRAEAGSQSATPANPALLSPLKPSARTPTAGQPSVLAAPVQRGPVMAPAQRTQMEYERSGAQSRGWRPEQFAAVQRAQGGSKDPADIMALRSWNNSDSFSAAPARTAADVEAYANAPKPAEPMTNPIKRAARAATNTLAETGNMALEAFDYGRGAIETGPRIPLLDVPEAQNVEQAAADLTGTIGGYLIPGAGISKGAQAGGQALRSVGAIGNAARAITPQGANALAKTTRVAGRVAATVPENAIHAAALGAIMGGEGNRLETAGEFAADPINYVAQPALMLLNRAGIFLRTAGQRATPEFVQVQRAEEVLRRANATPAEQAAAARVIEELTPPLPAGAAQPQAPTQPAAPGQPQPSVAPVVPPNVAQGAAGAAQPGPAGAGQQAAAGGAQPVLNATQVAPPVGPPGYTVTMAKSDAKIIGRILRDAGIPRNDVKPLLADTVTAYQRFVAQAHQSGEKVRLPLTFFAEDYLGQRLSADLAKNVKVKLQAFGNAANNSGDLAKAPVQRTAEELRGSQETYLTDIFERELGDESLRTTKNKIRGDKQLNAQAVYKTELTKGQQIIKEGKGTETQNKAFDKLLGKMRQDEFFAKIPYELKVKAGNDPDVNGDLSEYVIDHPLEAAHWLQSNLGVLARKGGENAGAYREMRMALLRPLEDAVQGYRGARKRAGDLVGQEIAINFGDDLFRKGRTEVQTAEMEDDFKRLSPAQKVVAERSIRDKLKNEFRASKEDAIDPVTGERVDSRGAMLTNLQKAGTLDAIEQILGAKGKRIADGIRNIMRENPRIPSYGSDSAKNIAERRAIEDAMRSPVNKAIGAAGDKTGWVVPIVADAAMGTFPLATGARIGGEILERFGQPSRKQIASAAKTLYALPPTPANRLAAPPAPRSGNRRPPPPRTGPRPPVTEADIEALRRQYDALDHGKAPKTSEQLARRIVNAEKRLAAQSAAPATPKPPRAKGNRLAAPTATPAAPPTPAKPKPPTPGQQSNASPAVTGALVGGAAGYAAAPEDQRGLGLVAGAVGGGVLGNRLAKAGKTAPKAPAGRGGAPNLPPAAPAAAMEARPAASVSSVPQSRTVAKVRMPNGADMDVPAEVFTNGDKVIMSPVWPTNMGDDLEAALKQRQAGIRAEERGMRLVNDAPQSPDWATQNPKEWADVQRQIGERFLGMVKSNPGPAHVLALVDGVDMNTLGSIIEAGMPRGSQLLRSQGNGEFAVVNRSWLRDNPKQFQSWEKEFPAYNQAKGLRPPPAEWSGIQPKSPRPANEAAPASASKPLVKGGADAAALKQQGFDTNTPLYHGTGANFDSFRVSETGLSGRGVYLTSSPKMAQEYAPKDGGKVMSVFVRGKIAGPDEVRQASEQVERAGFSGRKVDAVHKLLAERGYTGAKYQWTSRDETVVFDPADIVRSDASKPPPVKSGFGSSRLPMDEGSSQPRGPSTASRMVAGGVVGGVAGGLTGEAEPQTPETAQKIADNDAQTKAILADIAKIEGDMRVYESGDPLEMQKTLNRRSTDGAFIQEDGNVGPETTAAIARDKTAAMAALKEKRERLAQLELTGKSLERDAAFERTRPTDEQQSFRDFAPLLGGALGALIGKGTRLGGSAYSKVAAKSAIKELDTLLNNAPIPKPKTMAQREAVKSEIDRRASNLNEFWREGGADKPRNLKERVGMAQPKGVPFASKTDGEWTARAGRNVMSPSSLFPDRFIGRNVGPMDALIGGAGATEAYLANQNAERVKEDLKTAYKTAKDDPSEKNLARVQELEDQYALSKGWAMLGAGLAVGTGIGVFTSKYASKRGNVQMAEQELAILRRAIADLKRQPANALKTPKPPPAPSGRTIPPLPPARPRGTRKPPTP